MGNSGGYEKIWKMRKKRTPEKLEKAHQVLGDEIVGLPKILSEELLGNGRAVEFDALTHHDQMRRSVKTYREGMKEARREGSKEGVPVLRPWWRRMDSVMAHVDPLPLVPATWTALEAKAKSCPQDEINP